MRKRLALGLLVCCASLCLAVLLQNEGYISGILGGGREIVLKCPMPEMPKKVPHLKVVERDVTPVGITEVAEGLFKFSGDIQEIPDGLGLWIGVRPENQPSQELWMFSSGAIYYISGKDNPRYVPNSLPSYEQAREIAENFIQTIKTWGLVPRTVQIAFASVGPGAMSARGDENIVHYLNVQFELRFGGLTIGGPGGKVSVLVGENGEIIGFRGFWRDVEQDGNIPIRVTPQEALETMKTGLQVEKATVENITLGYYGMSVLERQEYLQPAYFFHMASREGGMELRWVEAILATGESAEPPVL